MKLGTKRTIIINGHQLAYYTLGHGAPLLFLHGGRVRAHTFHKTITELAKNYTVIAPDIPGYGDSETPKGIWSFTEYADLFSSLLDTLGLSAVTVMGYSMGGGIAFNLAAHSSYVNRLVLIDAAGLPLAGVKQSHHDLRRLSFYCSHPQYFSTLCTLIADFSRFTWRHRRDWRHMRTIRRRCFTTSYDTALHAINVPTDIIWGEDDWVLPLAIANTFQAHIPQAHVQIVRGNHDWLLYNHSQLNLPPERVAG